MSFESIANKVKDYAAVYDEALVMCNKIRDNATMSEHGKDLEIHKTVERYQPQIDAAGGRVIDEIDNTIAEIEAALGEDLISVKQNHRTLSRRKPYNMDQIPSRMVSDADVKKH